ncbi:MAG: GntR family transcriptional regulator [Pseudooceanicola sp.]
MVKDARNRHDRLHRAMREKICLLDWAPGAKLSETTIAAEFGTSRTPIRRALARLEDGGLVRSKHGVGTFVTEPDVHEIADIYAMRCELVELAGVLSPVSPTDDHMAILAALAERAHALKRAPDARALARLNMDFFDFGLSLTANKTLKDMSERLYYQTARLWLQQISALDLDQECNIATTEIEETSRALGVGDTRAAAAIRRAHVSMSALRINRAKTI